MEIVDLPREVIEELNEFLPEFWNKGNPIDLLGDATDKRFEKTFEVLARHPEFWDIAFIVSFPNLVLTSENLAKKILNFSSITQNRLVATLLGGDSMDPGRELLAARRLRNGLVVAQVTDGAQVARGHAGPEFGRAEIG